MSYDDQYSYVGSEEPSGEEAMFRLAMEIEAKREALAQDPLEMAGIRLVTFVSTSAGKDEHGEQRTRQPREVVLLVMKHPLSSRRGVLAYTVQEDHLVPRTQDRGVLSAGDQLASEHLWDIDETDRTEDTLIQRAWRNYETRESIFQMELELHRMEREARTAE